MTTATVYAIVAAVTAAAALGAAVPDLMRARWVLANMTRYGIPHTWIVPLGWTKVAGGLALLAGIPVRPLGALAAAALTAYFIGAVAAVLRGRCYADVVYPAPFLLLSAATLALAAAVL
ncbi:DoxX family protein [Nocardiopsis trehalosi]|uniref:DoxX family protein n=1 Tax=Nocardiopsis trehalosi TaxID=109329 RepID=UPI000AF759AA|nr:DoxX family protein [Nocardiopsis trehalosi]